MYNTLYRKYRPKSFDSVIGQDHITATLKNQIKSGRIGHAYLFCGSRGVGKTSLARIFARAINCTGEVVPCGKCDNCSKNAGENLDITEIDAASNNGVDDARDLREKVKYPPINGKYKVYIIDEVHMLTGAAFNALLKTLEEPPSAAVFILATTEPYKLPATILSRCMRFDFRLVDMRRLFMLLANIFNAEGKPFEDEALRAIAAAAEGSARDALSLADVCINLSGEKLTVADVARVIGGGSAITESLFDAIATGDVPLALELTDQLYESGKSMNIVAKELSGYARDLMLAKTAPKILKATNERIEHLVKAAENKSITGLAATLQLFSEMDSQLRYSVNPRIAMDAAVVRATGLYSLDLNALDARILRLERLLDNPAGLNLASVGSAGLTKTGAEIKARTESKPTVEVKPVVEKPVVEAKTALNKSNPLKNELAGGDDNELPPQDFYSLPPEDFSAPTAGVSAQKAQPERTPLTAQQLWGRIITYFRRNGTPAFTQAIGRQNPFKVFLKGELLTVFAAREDYLLMCDDALLEILKAAMLAEGIDGRVAVEKDSEDIDMEKAVEQLYQQFGRRKVNIISDK